MAKKTAQFRYLCFVLGLGSSWPPKVGSPHRREEGGCHLIAFEAPGVDYVLGPSVDKAKFYF